MDGEKAFNNLTSFHNKSFDELRPIGKGDQELEKRVDKKELT
jgi:hypothetical protein